MNAMETMAVIPVPTVSMNRDHSDVFVSLDSQEMELRVPVCIFLIKLK